MERRVMRPDPAENTDPDDIVVTPAVVVASHVLHFAFVGSSGPGGQNVNKRATKCTLRVSLSELPLTGEQLSRLCTHGSRYITDDGDVVISSDEHRSAPRNKAECADRLRELIARSLVAPRVRKPTRPSRGARERRLGEKKAHSDRKRRRRADGDD